MQPEIELRKKLLVLETPGIETRIQKEIGKIWKLVGTEAGRWEENWNKSWEDYSWKTSQ